MEKDQLVNMITKQVMQKLTGGESSIDTSAGELLNAGAGRVSSLPPFGACPDRALAALIDHTLLKADATARQVTELCKEAAENRFMSVCINPAYVSLARKLLRQTDVKVCTVIGFPLGASVSRVKELETRIAIDEGAEEVDMVINVGALKSGDLKLVEDDIRAVVRATRGTVLSKVILETCYLTKEEIKIGCELAKKAGANYVKTSTGFGPGGASPEDIRLMRDTVGDELGVKASGGIRDHETALAMIGAGASRIGASASVAIVECRSSAIRP